MKSPKIILASASPRRQEMLKKHNISFEVLVTDVDETVPQSLSPADFVSTISNRKAKAAEKQLQTDNAIIIAADTIVAVQNKILGKPKDKDDAFSMLKLLENRWHSVFTGLIVVFINGDKTKYMREVCETKVKFKALTESQIWDYISTNEPFDKAGAYAIQGEASDFVEKIDGDYNNVVGLPIDNLIKILDNN